MLGAVAYFACGSVLPVLLIMVCCFAAPIVIALSNLPVKERTPELEYVNTHNMRLRPEMVKLQHGCNFV